jgi:hypothetical protein
MTGLYRWLRTQLERLPKVSSSYPLSPQQDERVRVRRGEKNCGSQYKECLIFRLILARGAAFVRALGRGHAPAFLMARRRWRRP